MIWSRKRKERLRSATSIWHDCERSAALQEGMEPPQPPGGRGFFCRLTRPAERNANDPLLCASVGESVVLVDDEARVPPSIRVDLSDRRGALGHLPGGYLPQQAARTGTARAWIASVIDQAPLQPAQTAVLWIEVTDAT